MRCRPEKPLPESFIAALPAKTLGRRVAPRGFVLPMVIVLMLILSLYFATMSFLSRGQVSGAMHYLESSLAVNLADASVRWAFQELASGAFEPDPKYVPKAFYEHLFSGATADWSGEILTPDCIEEYRARISREGHSAEIVLKAFLSDLAPLSTEAAGGFPPDPVERSGKIRIEATALVGNAARKVVATRGLKLFRVVHPVLPKFSLFVKLPPLVNPEAAINPLRRKAAAAGFAGGLQPMNLENGVLFPVIQGGNLTFPAQGFNDTTIERVEREAGWVYLGGPRTWSLGLSGEGANDHDNDDRTLLRFATMTNEDPELTSWGSPLIAKGGSTRVDRFLVTAEGLRDDYPIPGGTRPLADLLFTRFLSPLDTGVSLIRLYGRAAEVSPTLVFGPVERRYLQIKTIDCTIGSQKVPGVGLPGFSSEADFTRAFTSPPAAYATDFNYLRILLELDPAPGKWPENWQRFRSAMTRIVAEPFNVSLDYLFSNREAGTVANPQSTSPCPVPNGFAEKLKLWKPAEGTVVDSLWKGIGTMLDAKGRTVFQGTLGEIEGIVELLPKVTARFDSFGSFAEFAMSGGNGPQKLTVPGIVFIDGDAKFTRPVEVRRGGVLLVRGNIEIGAAITAGSEPLTLISYKDILLDCPEPQRVEAHLVCLRGKFRAVSGSFHLVGSLAARELDFASLATKGKKTLTFARNHDPLPADRCSAATPGSLYRFRLSLEEAYSIEAGKN